MTVTGSLVVRDNWAASGAKEAEADTNNLLNCGGGAFVENARLVLAGGGEFTNNTVEGAAGAGGGVCLTAAGHLVASGPATAFTGNSAQGLGGGLFLRTGSTAAVSNAVFSGNRAASGAGVSLTGAVNVTLDNVTVTSNHADSNGGGIASPEVGRLNMTDCVVSNNTVSRVSRMGIWVLVAADACSGTVAAGRQLTR